MLLKIIIVSLGGLVSLIYMVLSPVGPGVFLSLTSPFDALFSGTFGIGGNAVTFLPLIALLLVSSPGIWVTQFFGTRIQQYIFAFLLMLIVSHVLTLSIFPESAVIEYLKKITLWMVIGVWAWCMRTPEQLSAVNRVLVVSTAVFTVLSMADFYFGIGAMPGADPSIGGIVGEHLEDVSSAHSLRYRGGGLPINRTANWLIMPAFLGFGWFMLSDRGRGRTLAIVCTIICVCGIFATVGRAAIVATIVGFLVLFPTAIGMKPTRILGAFFSATLIGLIGIIMMVQLGYWDLVESRFVGEESIGAGADRLDVYWAALRIWMTSPIIGVGDAALSAHPLYIGVTAHNSFLGLLAEAGLLGFLPYLGLTILFVRRFLNKHTMVDPRFDAWRPYFFAGFVASMTQNMFNEYTWERMIWYSVAYLIAHERADTAARMSWLRERRQSQDSGGPFPRALDESHVV